MSRKDNHESGGFDPDEDEAGSSSVFFFSEGGDTERRPIKELYSVFSRLRNDADRQAGELATQWGALDIMGGDVEEEMDRPSGVSEEEWRASLMGKVIEKEGRLLLQGLGGEEDMVYAAPTTTSATRSSQTAEAAAALRGRTDSTWPGTISRPGRSLYTAS